MSLDQTILFWNDEARAILGYTAGRVVGQRCHQVMGGLEDPGLTPDCADGCPCLRYARVGMVPAPMDVLMRCASGARKMLRVYPMVVSGVGDASPLVVYLFGDADEQAPAPGVTRTGGALQGSGGPLTPRETEVLRYLAMGWEVPNIAEELGLSANTVRNHSTNLRRKLDVRSSLEAVMVALRMGVLTVEDLGTVVDAGRGIE